MHTLAGAAPRVSILAIKVLLAIKVSLSVVELNRFISEPTIRFYLFSVP